MTRAGVADHLGRVALVALGFVPALLAAELTLRFVLPSPENYYVYPPELRKSFEPSSDTLPGIFGTSRFEVSSEGIRADELTDEPTYAILAVGGSTTQCLYLDQREAWPGRLQQLLQDEAGVQERVWVGNAGQAGRRTRDHVLQVRHLLPQLAQVDVLLLLVGANDIMRRLAEGDGYQTPDFQNAATVQQLLDHAFHEHPQKYAWYPPSRTALWAFPSRVKRAIRNLRHWNRVEDTQGRNYEIRRQERVDGAPFLDELPDLSAALDEYERNLKTIVELARRHGARTILMTQPSAYREDLPESHRRLLWMGYVSDADGQGTRRYYSPRALAEAFSLFNRRLLDLCRSMELECIDLASLVPKDTTSFYDDMHFNEAGADRVAVSIFEYLSRDVGPGDGGAEDPAM